MFELLVRGAVDGALFAAGVWIVTRLFPHLSPTTRVMLWWIAAAKFVIPLAWTTPLRLPLLPAAKETTGTGALDALSMPATLMGAPAAIETSPVDWPWLLVVLWAAGTCISLAWAARRWMQRRAVVRRSVPADGDVQQRAREVAARLHLRRTPQVRLSPSCDSPLITGIHRPVVLVPERFPAMTREQQRMTLCHELAHVKRGDLWLGLVPAVAERVFFFHPLARVAAREYVFWREVACDATVLSSLQTAPQAYGRLLLDLGIASGPATLAPAGAAWSFSSLKRRIVMLQRPTAPSVAARAVAVSVLLIATAALVPFRLVARAPSGAEPAVHRAEPAAMLPARPRSAVPAAVSSRPDAPADQERSPGKSRDVRFVFMSGDNTTMSGSTSDIRRARRQRKSGEDLLWFEWDGKEYIVRDSQVLGDIRRVWDPVSSIGTEQGVIGGRQGEIGAKQAEIGSRQAAVGMEQSAIGAKQARIGSQQAALAARETGRLTSAQRTEIDRQMRALDDEMRAMDVQMRALDAKMRELDAPMNELGKRVDELGADMDVLGRKMEEAQKKAEEEMRALIERAIASGAAQIVR